MLPEKTNKSLQLFELSENKLIRNRQLMLQVPEVKRKLSNIESLVTESTTKMMIKEVPEPKQLELIAFIIENICKDLGIVKWNSDKDKRAYTLTRFKQVIDRYYSDLSFSSIKLAFELLAIGELDDFLPKDKNGKADKNNYGEFSFEFYTRVLNAFRKRSGEVWGKVRLALPKTEITISEEEKKQNANIIIEEIYDCFDNYKTKNETPNFDIQVHFNCLLEKGLVTQKEPTKDIINKAYIRLKIDYSISKEEKKELTENKEKNIVNLKLKVEAQRIENNITIKNYFDSLLQNKKDIREFLKQNK